MRDLQHQVRQNQLEQELVQSNSSPEYRSEASAIATSCNEAYEDLLKFYHEFEHQRPSNWRMLKNHRNVHLYQGPATKSHRIPVSYRFTTQIDATIEEVQAHMSNLTTADMKDTMEKYADGIVDMRVLRHIQGPYNNEPDLHILVRWFANEFPKPLRNRDFCVAEIQNGCTLASGQRAWALVQHSVELQSCPDISKAISIRYQRAQMHHFGLLFVETLPGLIDVFVHLEIDFKGYPPSWLYPLIIKRRALSLAKLNEYMHIRRQGQLGLQVPVAERKHCQYCARKFSPLWWKIHCYFCGEVFCSKCVRSTGHGLSKSSYTHKICIECSANGDTSLRMTERSSGRASTQPRAKSLNLPRTSAHSDILQGLRGPSRSTSDIALSSRKIAEVTSSLPLLHYELNVSTPNAPQVDDEWNKRLLNVQEQIAQHKNQLHELYSNSHEIN